MKKITNIVLIILISVCLFACNKSEEVSNDNNNQEQQSISNDKNSDQQLIDDVIGIDVKENEEGKTLTFSRMLVSVDDLKQLDITDEYQSVCAIIFTLARFEDDKDVSKQMLEYINGPEDVSDFDIDFMKNQIKQYPYVIRSYFDNTSPEENYEVKEVSITIKENLYSRDENDYVKLWLHSSGADFDRSVMLRKKESTGEWFLFSDTYKGLMASIRIPTDENKWS